MYRDQRAACAHNNIIWPSLPKVGFVRPWTEPQMERVSLPFNINPISSLKCSAEGLGPRSSVALTVADKGAVMSFALG